MRLGGNLFSASKNNWAPQIGFAWRPFRDSSRLVVRGGFGIGYTRTEGAILSNFAGNPPFVSTQTLEGCQHSLCGSRRCAAVLRLAGESRYRVGDRPGDESAANGLSRSQCLLGEDADSRDISLVPRRHSTISAADWIATLGLSGQPEPSLLETAKPELVLSSEPEPGSEECVSVQQRRQRILRRVSCSGQAPVLAILRNRRSISLGDDDRHRLERVQHRPISIRPCPLERYGRFSCTPQRQAVRHLESYVLPGQQLDGEDRGRLADQRNSELAHRLPVDADLQRHELQRDLHRQRILRLAPGSVSGRRGIGLSATTPSGAPTATSRAARINTSPFPLSPPTTRSRRRRA